ncbi:MAG: hypothetical protein ACPHRO_09905, partial [Nannocystaceae bacterium]
VPRDAPVQLHLRGELSPDSLGQIAVVPLLPGDPCMTGLECTEGPCDAGRCWAPSMSRSDLAALDQGAYEEGWPVRVTQETAAHGASSVWVHPAITWRAGWRYRVWVGDRVRGADGVPLAPSAAVGEMVDGRWSWDFFVSEVPEAPALVWPYVPHGLAPLAVPDDLTHIELIGEVAPSAHLRLVSDGADSAVRAPELLRDGPCDWSDAPGCGRYRVLEGLEAGVVYGVVESLDPAGAKLEGWAPPVSPTIQALPRPFGPAEVALHVEADARCVYVTETEGVPGLLRVESLHLDGDDLPASLAYEGPSTGVGGWGIPWNVLGLAPSAGQSRLSAPGDASSARAPRALAWSRATPWGFTSGRVEVDETPGIVGPGIRITEVLADPLGPEPAQEFVEIQIKGGGAWMEGDLWIADRTWEEVRAALDGPEPAPIGDPLPGATLEEGQVVLIVPEDFDETSMMDGEVPPSARLLRVPGSLGVNGLLNAGEPLSIYRASPPELLASFGTRGGVASAGPGASVTRADLGSWCDGVADWRSAGDQPPTP